MIFLLMLIFYNQFLNEMGICTICHYMYKIRSGNKFLSLWWKKMDDEARLQRLVEKISLQYFEMPFLHKAILISRLRTTGGRYLLKS